MLRDQHRIREKISLSLDERQVAPLALAALILFGAVFALGVYIGKGLAGSAPVPPPIGELDQLDARKDAPRAPVAAAPPVDDAAAREKARVEAAKAAQKKLAEQKAAQEKAEKERAEREKQDREKAAREKAEREKAKEKALAAAAAKAREEGTAPPAEGEAGAEEPKGPEGAPGGPASFTVQIGSLPTREEADSLVAKAKAAGIKPYVVEADLGEKGTWYRIRAGTYPDKDQAEAFRRDVEKKLEIKALVMPSH